MIRDYDHATDQSLVFSSWCSHIRGLQPFSAFDGEAFARHKQLLERLVGRGRTRVVCNPEYPAQIFGWCCSEGSNVLHFIYVRNMWRQRGCATRLLQDAFGDVVGRETIFVTHPGRSLRHQAKRWKLVLNPYLTEEDAPHRGLQEEGGV